MLNSEVVKLLRQVAAAFTIKDEKKYHFQIVAYQKAADSIERMTTEVSDLYIEHKLQDIPGVGQGIQAHLEELMSTGKVQHFETVLKAIPPSVFPLLTIPSFGPRKAMKLVSAFRLKDPATVIEEIVKHAKSGDIARLETFGEKSQSDILRAVAEYKKGAGKTTRMLLPYAAEVADKVVTYLKESEFVVDVQPLGSLRRRTITVGDVDIAISSNHPENVISYFTEYPYKSRIIEKGPSSASLLTTGGQQVDLMVQPVEQFGSLLQHFTGSKHHNVHLREFALKKGLSLSEYGIKNLDNKSEKRQTFKTEEAFYHALDMDWIPPELREDTGEIEAAVKHNLPQLITLNDIKGDLHIHSNYPIEPSHDLGMDSMQEMLINAQQKGYEYLGFSEHNPSVSKHSKQEIYSLLSKRKDYIEQIKKSNKYIRVINLLEIDILASGELAIDDKAFSCIDAGIVSIHSSFGMDEDQMTRRVLQGLSHPKAKILAHPTGRLINTRNGYALDWKKIFAFCTEHKKAIEINSWPERADLPETLIHQAIQNGVQLVIDTDSHATTHMNLMTYGVSLARRGWAEKRDILNSLVYNKFIDWLKQ